MIKRYFTDNNDNGWAFETKLKDIEIKNKKTGETVYSHEGCVFPEHFSDTACDIIASKYFYRGADEHSYYELIERMVDFWTDALIDEGVLDEDEAETFWREALYTLENQYWAPNSPQWFNTGLYQTYGVDSGDDEIYHASENGVVTLSKHPYEYPQSSACFILDVKDTLLGPGSISDHYVTETKLFKRGSGVGTNFSKVRASGEKLSGGGTSSGLMSFLEGLDKNAGAIKSGGTTRRAAKMVIVDADHPEIEDFIDWKVREEKKAKVLGQAGYDMSIGGEAYNTVSGQNSNNSIRVTDEFMGRALCDEDWKLKGRVDKDANKVVKAGDIFDKIVEAAWECGDPGLQFADAIENGNTCKNSGTIYATNPCSEFAFLDNTACNLASINLGKFLIPTSDNDYLFDIEAFDQVVRIAQLAMEASIHWGGYPTEEIAKNSIDYRPTGLGIASLGEFLNTLGLPYDSEKARSWASVISSMMTAQSYEVSAEIAERVGAFNKYQDNMVPMQEVLSEHALETANIDTLGDPKIEFLIEIAKSTWINVLGKAGYRNAQVTCIAPTGTISFAMDCETTGIEPYFSRETVKTLADGSTIVATNEGVIKTADEISPIDHVKMVAAIQPFVSGAISKTVNMPANATIEDVRDVFVAAWYMDCKSITIYRDGSKGAQVLNKVKEKDQNTLEEALEYAIEQASIPSTEIDEDILYEALREYEEKHSTNDQPNFSDDTKFFFRPSDGIGRYGTFGELRKHTKKKIDKAVKQALEEHKTERIKPEGIRKSRTHAAKIGDIELYITVGYYDDGGIAELFISNDKEGTIVRGLLASLSKSISHQFQNGESPQEIAKMLRGQRYEPSGVVERHPNIKFAESISDLVSKIIDIECGDYSRCQVKPEEDEGEEVLLMVTDVEGNELWRRDLDEDPILKKHSDVVYADEMSDYDEEGTPYWKDSGERIYGELCSNCGSDRLVRTGTCKVCSDCGTTTGCS